MNNFKHKEGSALLVAILIMAVLLVFGLGINILIVMEMKAERGLVSGGQAYYSAEGAVEMAMYDVVTNMKGYEVVDEAGSLSNEADYVYSIEAMGETWPCYEYGDKIYTDDAGAMWRVLETEESVMIPLFDDAGKITNFTLYYYTMDEGGIFPTGEVLRWKVIGINEDSGLTEAISAYDILMGFPSSFESAMKTGGYYMDIGTTWGGREYEYLEANLKSFLELHSYNYLTVTNVVNEESDMEYDLYVRMSDANVEFVCEYVKVVADGTFGDYVQKIDSFMKEGEPLPVFDFVLWEKDL
ncbi:MAG: hypothetical protein UV80_C0001G0056 [Candidatus Peregrinibacteria bacterium GW2011_GWF2_43_17]|nr:MAG: hypothetical protein UV80_C0001G0056 [Candidatus Peregrinibacteria bacterium GW2011_GWF2_43_17]KKT20497.1 MAG: hypothetical protein UW03_C0003G0033 [Candidatus Peregrinibacteria bacterium GW2011_GWA2_43_8]HAU40298.1 hypothetical protein [Candidatus Peregrinibacteria bacterium]